MGEGMGMGMGGGKGIWGMGGRRVKGGWGGVACLCGFALSVMTVSKTVLYGEFFFCVRG